jgi:hypothetical protein
MYGVYGGHTTQKFTLMPININGMACTVMGLGRPVHEPYNALHLNLDHATPLGSNIMYISPHQMALLVDMYVPGTYLLLKNI